MPGTGPFTTRCRTRTGILFIWQLGVFSVLAAFFIVSAVYQIYLQQWLQMRWRRWLTNRYLGRWLSNGTHYRMRLKGDAADNPDQRIADDIKQFINSTLDMGISLLGSIVTLVSFVVILWSLSASTPLMIGSQSFNIPGYLVWAALVYAIVGTWVTHLVGKPLVKLNFDQQRYEADFRFSLVRLRENAEEVTLLAGEPAEKERLLDRFGRVVGNWYGIMQRTKRLTFLTAGYSQVAIIFPFIVVSPLYFAGAMMLGGLMQIASAFGQVQGALSFFVKAYSDIADWKAVLNRLAGFDASMDWATSLDTAAPRVDACQRRRQRAAGRRSHGEPAERRGDRARPPALRSRPASSVLVTGPSGSGKTSLFRALGGVWPFGAGTVRIPHDAKLLVLPQRPYLPLGTLRGALAYPDREKSFTPAEIDDVLRATNLGDVLHNSLDETASGQTGCPWASSRGCRSRARFCRSPTGCSSDEATAALDEPAEAMLYRLLLERLPHAAIVSIGHRSSLLIFHERFLALRPDGKGRHRLMPVSA